MFSRLKAGRGAGLFLPMNSCLKHYNQLPSGMAVGSAINCRHKARHGVAERVSRKSWEARHARQPGSACPTGRAFLDGLFRTAVAAAHPASCLPPHLPAPPASGRLIVLAAGKAAGSMTEVAERHYLDARHCRRTGSTGLAVTRHGYGRPTRA